jgi:hypothetical protein
MVFPDPTAFSVSDFAVIRAALEKVLLVIRVGRA